MVEPTKPIKHNLEDFLKFYRSCGYSSTTDSPRFYFGRTAKSRAVYCNAESLIRCFFSGVLDPAYKDVPENLKTCMRSAVQSFYQIYLEVIQELNEHKSYSKFNYPMNQQLANNTSVKVYESVMNFREQIRGIDAYYIRNVTLFPTKLLEMEDNIIRIHHHLFAGISITYSSCSAVQQSGLSVHQACNNYISFILY